MERFRKLQMSLLIVGLAACAGGESESVSTGEPSSTFTSSAAPTTTSGAAVATTTAPSVSTTTQPGEVAIPADFPVPIHEGGTVVEAHAFGAIVLYPASELDALVAHYEAISQANGGTHFDLFPEGDTWDVEGIQISVYPVDPATDPYPADSVVLDISLP